MRISFKELRKYFHVFEFSSKDNEVLPNAPGIKEKFLYASDKGRSLLVFSVISFIGVSVSLFNFLLHNPSLWPMYIVFSLTILYFVVSMAVNSYSGEFNLLKHRSKVRSWRPNKYPSVDIFLPVAGEPLPVLANTWRGVRRLVRTYPGITNVYVLDDSDSRSVAKGANIFGFHYKVRPDRGYFKKAGNLRYGYKHSNGDYIVIFDADFVPSTDFLFELLPYFDDPKVGLVQSPQYFDVHGKQNWLERGAGAVQELFYRFSQVSRQHHDASICVGSNAVYRRRALQDIGGTALIEHSEDVHTGFNLRKKGWTLQYVPVIVAKGLCPSSMSAFFKQQYRWCTGSLSLLCSKKFWTMRMRIRTRLSYISGFMYYISTAVSVLYAPVIPLILLLLLPEQINILNYSFVLPSLIFVYIVLPAWHRATYGIEAWSTKQVYGWAHLFAIVDKIRGRQMGWVPTGTKVRKDHRYRLFRGLQVCFNVVPAIVWVGEAAHYAMTVSLITYIAILCTGIYYLFVSLKVSLFGVRLKPFKFAISRKSRVSAAVLEAA